jgi:hypothetical protein
LQVAKGEANVGRRILEVGLISLVDGKEVVEGGELLVCRVQKHSFRDGTGIPKIGQILVPLQIVYQILRCLGFG